MATISLTWNSLHDDHVCPICKSLDNFTWIFPVGQNKLDGQLTHPTHGIVWNIQHGSEAHLHHGKNWANPPATGECRCYLTYNLDITDLLERVREIHRTVLDLVALKELKEVSV